MKKIYLYTILVVAAIIAGVIILNNNKTAKQAEVSPSPSVLLPSASASPSLKPKSKAMLNVEIHDKLAVQYDRRRILLAADCESASPSNVDYKNGTKIMIDNIASSEARVIKLGGISYNIPASNWIFVTLQSPILPVNLPLFCGSMELGQIGIIK